nr:DHA2 family efflux MFS transporter permease subunit [Sinomonas humi]
MSTAGLAPSTAEGGRRRWVGLVVISLAVSLIIVDSTIVNVAIPSIVKDLGVDSTGVQWVQESYTLVFAALLLVFGTLGDRYGRRLVLIVGVVVFALSSVVAALAPSGELLIAARFVQGVGGAMVLPSTLSLINAGFAGPERAIALAVWGSTIGGMTAVGPLLGGWLTTAYSWRWAFGINIPLGIVIVTGALLAVAESRDDARRRLDPVGAVLSVVASASLVFALIEGRNYGWWAVDHRPRLGSWEWPGGVSPIPLAFGVALLAILAWVSWARARERRGLGSMFAIELLRIRSFRNGNLAAMIVSLGEFGIILALPIWLQNVLGFTALDTGLILLALALGSFGASGLAGAFSGRVRPIVVVRVGLAAEIVGVAGLGDVVRPDAPWAALVPFLFVYGFGVGLATAQLTGVILTDVPVSASGQASGTQSTSRQIGSALGIAVLGTVLFSSASGLLSNALDQRGIPAAQRDSLVSAVVDSSGAAISQLAASPATAPAAGDAKEAFSDGTRYAAWSAAAFLVVGLAATLSLGNARDEVTPGASGTQSGQDPLPRGRRRSQPSAEPALPARSPRGSGMRNG